MFRILVQKCMNSNIHKCIHAIVSFDVTHQNESKACINIVRAISIARLKTLLSVHLRPINLVVSEGTYQSCDWRNLIFELASHLDAFSGYPFRT